MASFSLRKGMEKVPTLSNRGLSSASLTEVEEVLFRDTVSAAQRSSRTRKMGQRFKSIASVPLASSLFLSLSLSRDSKFARV